MSKPRKPRDPFAKRESENYSNPIASREFILEQLEAIGEPVSHPQLCEHLKLHDEEQVEALRRRLIAMSRDGQIISNRRGVYGLAGHMDLIKGRVQGNKDGFGFFIPDDGSEDLFLNAREMDRLFDGDRVLARLTGFDSRGRREGTIVEILQRRYTEIVGRYYKDNGFGLVIADSKRINHEILIPDNQAGDAEDGQFVVAELVEYPAKRRKAVGRIAEVLGDVATPGLEIDIAVRAHDIPHVFPAEVNKETGRFPQEVGEQDQQGRFDLRHLPFVTIDGEDAKDFDDAVFAHRHQRGNWTLYVGIADVSHYVGLSSALDEEAQLRGTSVYFPGHVIPMLPEKLSNGLCSLKPKVDRLAMVCEMEISAQGEMTDYSFYETVIHSHARLTYTEVADMVQQPENETQVGIRDRMRKRHESLLGPIDDLYALYHALRQRRTSGGAMDFDTVETRIVFGENRKIREIVPVVRNEAHRLIEECMLCANVAAALLVESNKIPALYRIHEGPNPDKLDNLREFLGEMGLHLGGGEKPTPADYQRTLQHMAQRPDRLLLQTMLIRSMMQAVYQPDNLGHFGLGFEAYTHFTSPIRRYPDLLVHRAIRYLIRNKKGPHLQRHETAAALSKKHIYPYDEADLDGLGVSCSVAERRADAASYNVIDWLKCEYMQSRVGDEFKGTVTSVTSFGLFVELTDIYIEGLVHITELSNDYYHFDPIRHCLEGERSRQVYRLGDVVEVRVVRVDLDDKKIDLQMLNSIATSHSRKQRGKATGKAAGKPTGKPKGKKDKHRHTDKEQGESKSRRKGKSQGKSKSKTQHKKKSKHAGRGKDSSGEKGTLQRGEVSKKAAAKKSKRKQPASKKKPASQHGAANKTASRKPAGAGKANQASKGQAGKKARQGSGKPRRRP